MKKLRLVEVIVQPVVVVDDGEQLAKIEHPSVVIPAAEWETYSADRFPRELADWERKLNERPDEP